MNRATIFLAAAAFSGFGGATAALGQNSNATEIARVDLRPLNASGASGNVTLRLSSDKRSLTVVMEARGLEPGGVHISHIHGLSTQAGQPVDSTCPTSAEDSDGDGFVELAEGGTKYGPILIDFMNVDPDGDGRVSFTKTFALSGSEMALPLGLRHIVVHGKSVPAGPGQGTPGEVNGTNGYLTVLPVLCGDISPKGRGAGDAMTFRRPSN